VSTLEVLVKLRRHQEQQEELVLARIFQEMAEAGRVLGLIQQEQRAIAETSCTERSGAKLGVDLQVRGATLHALEAQAKILRQRVTLLRENRMAQIRRHQEARTKREVVAELRDIHDAEMKHRHTLSDRKAQDSLTLGRFVLLRNREAQQTREAPPEGVSGALEIIR
jgi:flagellar biosynthesis chaperone FliJ